MLQAQGGGSYVGMATSPEITGDSPQRLWDQIELVAGGRVTTDRSQGNAE